MVPCVQGSELVAERGAGHGTRVAASLPHMVTGSSAVLNYPVPMKLATVLSEKLFR